MKNEALDRLTALFQRTAQNRSLSLKDLTLSVETADDAEVTVRLSNPAQAAQYMRFFLNTNDPKFKRFALTLSDKTPLNSPIVFRAQGMTYDPMTRMHFTVQMIRLRFFEAANPSELCFDDNFCRTDWHNHHSFYQGPSAHEFVKALEKAGQNWQDLNFVPPGRRKAPHLRLVG